MNAMMQDPTVLYAIAFTIFILLAVRYGRKPMLGWLDNEILKIRDELDQARALRAEAEATLADYKQKQASALAEANAIIAHAQEETARLKSEAEAKLKALLASHEQQALERVRQAEAEAVADVRAAAVDIAMTVATQILSEKIDATTASQLVDQAIAALPKTDKAEAA